MRSYWEASKSYLAAQLKPWRVEKHLTQEGMAEMLRMASRSYSDLERGKSGFSATTLMMFLSIMSDEEVLRLVHGFKKEVLENKNKLGDMGVIEITDIYDLLRGIGLTADSTYFFHTSYAVWLLVQKRCTSLDTTELYSEVARRYDTTSENIEQGMQSVVNEVWTFCRETLNMTTGLC